jgi:hypothetical protein
MITEHGEENLADLKAKFEKAAVDIQKLSKKPDNDTLLKQTHSFIYLILILNLMNQ